MTARALTLAALGVALSFTALWWPLTWWALPVQVVGILLLGVGAHGLIAAVDPPDTEDANELVDELTEPVAWPTQHHDHQEAA